MSIFIFSQYFSNRFGPVEKYGVNPHCLQSDFKDKRYLKFCLIFFPQVTNRLRATFFHIVFFLPSFFFPNLSSLHKECRQLIFSLLKCLLIYTLTYSKYQNKNIKFKFETRSHFQTSLVINNDNNMTFVYRKQTYSYMFTFLKGNSKNHRINNQYNFLLTLLGKPLAYILVLDFFIRS